MRKSGLDSLKVLIVWIFLLAVVAVLWRVGLLEAKGLLLMPGFFSISLICLAFIVFSVWEISFVLHPERFSAETNAALRCDNCTDLLCGREYCET